MMEIQSIIDIIDQHPLLPAGRQMELVTRVRTGIDAQRALSGNGHDSMRAAELQEAITTGDAAREILILHNAGMALKIAWQYVPQSQMDLEDLFQEGIIGLITAIERFNPAFGTQLSTHAYFWIRQAIVRAISIKSRTIRISTHQHHRVRRLHRMRQRLASELHREPTRQELAGAAEEAGDTPLGFDATELMQLADEPISLDDPTGTSGDPLVYFIPGDEEIDGDVEHDDLRRRVLEIVETLPAREALAIKMRYGLDGYEPHKLHEVGEAFGVTRGRARQIVADGLHRLRHPSRMRRLEGLL